MEVGSSGVAIFPPFSNNLVRSFFGSQRLALVPVNATIWF